MRAQRAKRRVEPVAPTRSDSQRGEPVDRQLHGTAAEPSSPRRALPASRARAASAARAQQPSHHRRRPLRRRARSPPGRARAHPQTQRVPAPLRSCPLAQQSSPRQWRRVNPTPTTLDAATGLFRCAGAGNAAYLSCRQLHNLLATARVPRGRAPIRTDSVERLGSSDMMVTPHVVAASAGNCQAVAADRVAVHHCAACRSAANASECGRKGRATRWRPSIPERGLESASCRAQQAEASIDTTDHSARLCAASSAASCTANAAAAAAARAGATAAVAAATSACAASDAAACAQTRGSAARAPHAARARTARSAKPGHGIPAARASRAPRQRSARPTPTSRALWHTHPPPRCRPAFRVLAFGCCAAGLSVSCACQIVCHVATPVPRTVRACGVGASAGAPTLALARAGRRARTARRGGRSVGAAASDGAGRAGAAAAACCGGGGGDGRRGWRRAAPRAKRSRAAQPLLRHLPLAQPKRGVA